MSEAVYDVAIIGSGPSGLTAGIYASRGNLKTLLLAGNPWGGQLMLTTEVENFPGFVDGVMGPTLINQMKQQSERFGTEFVMEVAAKIEKKDGLFVVTSESGNDYWAKAVIVATGADARWLGVRGEQELRGRGVSSCATCDAAFFRDKKVMVVGGGDSAMEEALFLTKFAKEVLVVHRRESFRASKIMADRVMNHEKIKVVFNTEVVEFEGDAGLKSVKFVTEEVGFRDEYVSWADGERLETKDGVVEWRGLADGVFVAIGHTPNTGFVKGMLEIDEKGYVKRMADETGFDGVDAEEFATLRAKYPSLSSVEGVFVSGDVHDHHYRQAITAAAYGCMAAIDCERWLEDVHGVEVSVESW